MDQQEKAELTGLAAALTGDPAAAADLLGQVAALTSRPAAGEDDSGETARALLVERFLRRPPAPVTRSSIPVELDAELEPVLTRLDRLPALPRAVLVLQHRDQGTLAELVRLTGRPAPVVDRALAEAAATVDAPPWALRQVLDTLPLPQPDTVRAAERRWAARRRRIRGRVLLAVLATAALVVAASVLPGLVRPDPYVRAAGEWVYGFRLTSTPDFVPLGRSLSATEDVLRLSWAAHRGVQCTISLSTVERPVVPAGRALAFEGRAARFVPASTVSAPALWWSVGRHTTGLATCEASGDDAALLQLARLVRYEPVQLKLPFAFSSLGAEDEVRLVFDYPEGSGAIVAPRGQPEDSRDAFYVSVSLPTLLDQLRDKPAKTVIVEGDPRQVYTDPRALAMCWQTGRHTTCVGAYPLLAASRQQRDRVLDRVVSAGRSLRVAPDVDDRAGWFAAADALPR